MFRWQGPSPNRRCKGRLKIENGAVAYIDLPSALSDINGSLIFNQDRLQVEETLTAHTGGGLVTFGGYATAYNNKLNFDLDGCRARTYACAILPGSARPQMPICVSREHLPPQC